MILKYGSIEIASIQNIHLVLNSQHSIFGNLATYYVSAIQLEINATFEILGHLASEYWMFSLFVDYREIYLMPASTMWATTHLPSIFIIFYIILWLVATRMLILRKIRLPKVRSIRFGRIVISFNLDPIQYPVTILVSNLLIYVGGIYAVIKAWDLVAAILE